MGEKWFQFVKRVKKEQGLDSLKDAMIYAASNKCQWKRDGASSEVASASSGKKTQRSGTLKKGSRRSGSKKQKKGKTLKRKSCCPK
jgi:hypothetical protein